MQLGAWEWCEVVGSQFAFLRTSPGARSEYPDAMVGWDVTTVKAHESTKSIDIAPIRPVLARVIDRWHPLQIWLFGSRARGENRPDSDWDLLAIVPDCPEPADFDDPMTVWRVKREPGVSSDLVVYRRSDFDEDRSVPNTLAYSTRLDGVLVYER